jgi:putative glutamine amidotransferase
MNHRPLIGIVMNYDDTGAYFAKTPWYALRRNYFEAIQKAGGAPVALPYHIDNIPDYMRVLDGLVIAGGPDYPPEFYGEVPIPHLLRLIKGGRAEFDFKLLDAALKKNIPVLGICAGEQAINIYFGGTLHQDIQTHDPKAMNHLKPKPVTEASHSIAVKEGTLLHRITGKTTYEVNSSHHQAVNRVGQGLVVNAIAPDGVIEGVEHPDYKFCLGLEWHPEFETCVEDTKVFSAFLNATQS